MPRTAGFTLIEILVALVISGFLAGVMFQFIQGQGRFTAMQTARQEVQQNARGALDLIASELRGLGAGGLMEAGADRIRYRSPRAWGVLCDALPSATGRARVRFPAGVLGAVGMEYGDPRWGLVVVPGAPNPPAVVPGPANPGGTPDCDIPLETEAVPAGQVDDAEFSSAVFSSATAAPGSLVYVYEEVLYEVRQSSLGGPTRPWIYRMLGYSGGTANMQPLAGPLDGGDGLQFRYYESSLGSWSSTPTDPTDVTRVLVMVRTESSAPLRDAAQTDSVSTIVDLRNRQ